MESGGEGLDLPSSPVPGADLNRPHRSLVLRGAVSLGARGVFATEAESTVNRLCVTTVSGR